MDGSGTRSRRRPSRSEVLDALGARRALAGAREAQVLAHRRAARPWSAARGCAGDGLVAAARRRGAGSSTGRGSAVTLRGRTGRHVRYSVFTAWPPNSLRSAASTLAP